MPLSRPRSRRFVVVLVFVMLAFAVLATVLITRGWNDEALQARIRAHEAEEGR